MALSIMFDTKGILLLIHRSLFYIHYYGLMINIGIFSAVILSYFSAQRKKIISGNLYLGFILAIVIGCFFGARLLSLFYNWHTVAQDWASIWHFISQGKIFGYMLGAACGAIITGSLYAALFKIKALQTWDIIATYTPLTEIFGRIGCFIAACCGGYSAPQFLLAINGRHPTQLYTSGACLITFSLLLAIRKRLYAVPGLMFFVSFGILNFVRFIFDFLREDRAGVRLILSLNVSSIQLVALVLMTLSVIGGFFVMYKHRSDQQPT